MSGTLTVQNLQGPTTGANANKVIVPSGHTLDASEGFTPPTGHVVKTSTWKPIFSSTLATTTMTDLATATFDFTQNSIINVTGMVRTRHNGSSGWRLVYIGVYVDGIGQVYHSSYIGSEAGRIISSNPINFSFTWTVSGSATVRLQGSTYGSTTGYFGNADQASASTQNDFLTFMEIAQ